MNNSEFMKMFFYSLLNYKKNLNSQIWINRNISLIYIAIDCYHINNQKKLSDYITLAGLVNALNDKDISQNKSLFKKLNSFLLTLPGFNLSVAKQMFIHKNYSLANLKPCIDNFDYIISPFHNISLIEDTLTNNIEKTFNYETLSINDKKYLDNFNINQNNYFDACAFILSHKEKNELDNLLTKISLTEN